jgi:hypothetical protein
MPVSFLAFQSQQRFQIKNVTLVLFYSLFSQGNEVGADGRRTHCFAVLPDAGVFQILSGAFPFRLVPH